MSLHIVSLVSSALALIAVGLSIGRGGWLETIAAWIISLSTGVSHAVVFSDRRHRG